MSESIATIRDKLHEFIVVDAGTPNIGMITKNGSNPTIIDGHGSTRGGGKNIGFRHATGEIIAFLDDDVVVDDNWISELLHSAKDHDIIAGYSENPEGKDIPRVSLFVSGQDITYPTCNIAIHNYVYKKVGGFDETFVTAEDIDFNYRSIIKGYTIHYNPNMKVLHYHRNTLRGFAKQAYWNGFGRKQLNKKYPELKDRHNHGLNSKQLFRLLFGALGYTFGRV